VHSADREARARLIEERHHDAEHFLLVGALCQARGAGHAVYDKARVGRRIEIGGQKVDEALRPLRAFQKPSRHPHARQQFLLLVVAGARVQEANHKVVQKTAGIAGPGDPELILAGAVPAAGWIRDLRAQTGFTALSLFSSARFSSS
jgi:hypothetical protein